MGCVSTRRTRARTRTKRNCSPLFSMEPFPHFKLQIMYVFLYTAWTSQYQPTHSLHIQKYTRSAHAYVLVWPACWIMYNLNRQGQCKIPKTVFARGGSSSHTGQVCERVWDALYRWFGMWLACRVAWSCYVHRLVVQSLRTSCTKTSMCVAGCIHLRLLPQQQQSQKGKTTRCKNIVPFHCVVVIG